MAQAREASRPAGVGIAGALYRKLSPGPAHPAREVASHQRARICGAMLAAVAERGYAAVTVRELVRLAGVSTHTFYELFGGKEGCLLGTYELAMLENSENLCAHTYRATAKFDAQNGKISDFNPVLKPQCGKERKGKGKAHHL